MSNINEQENVIDLTGANVGEKVIPASKDWRDFPTRVRQGAVVTLTEGDILVKDTDSYFHVAEGEVTVYAGGEIDESRGELAEVAIEGVQEALAEGKTFFNMEDAG